MSKLVLFLGLFMLIPFLLGIVTDDHRSKELPKQVTVRIPGTTVPFTMVKCPPGSVKGDNGERYDIKSLFVLTTEVSWDLYDIYLYELDEPDGSSFADGVSRPSKPYVPPDRGFGHDGYPTIGMTRHGAEAFCEWITLKTGLEIRLPTSQEWIYLCVGDSGEPFCCGKSSDTLEEIAWFEGNSEHSTHPIGLKEPNQFGLFDMHGNAAEWVMSETPKPIAMGGSYRDLAEECTSASSQMQIRAWNISDPQIPKSVWWLADCSWVGFRFVVETDTLNKDILKELSHE